MSRSLLNMLNSVLGRSGFLQRASFASSTDPDNIQMAEYANKAAQDILEYAPWPKLRTTKTYTLTTATTYALPSDFGDLVAESPYHGTRDVNLPTNDREWAWLKAANPGLSNNYYAKLIGGQLVFDSVTSGDTITLDYISNTPIQAADTSYKTRFTADTDTFVLDEEALLLAIAAFWKGEKGIETAQHDYAMYQRQLRRALARDYGMKTIRTEPRTILSPVANDYAL